jgi:hypothetical protein
MERLQYGRDQLVRFWEKEIEIVRQAMGFRHKAYIQFDQMTLSDEAAEKNLLIQLADRDIISQETLLQRFNEIPQIEKIRLQREVEDRQDDKNPKKASPYHTPQHKENLEKIGLQTGKVLPQDVGLKTTVPKDMLLQPKGGSPFGGGGNPQVPPKPANPNGRPPNSGDTAPRKQRIAKPKSEPGVAELVVWTEDTWSTISETVNNAYLNHKNKKNLRQLTKIEASELETIKLDILTNIPIFADITDSSIYSILNTNKTMPKHFKDELLNRGINLENMNVEKFRKNALGLFIEQNASI